MEPASDVQETIELLKQFGLKEYEARCFVGLTCLDTATSKELSQVTEVPRTRVYDAMRVLESQGLVEVHYTSPKRFRAIPTDDALEQIRTRYGARLDDLQESLTALDSVDVGDEGPERQVWTITGRERIELRTTQLLREATEEVVLVLGTGSGAMGTLGDVLEDVASEARVHFCGPAETVERYRGDLPPTATVTSDLEWLHTPSEARARAGFGRLLLTDRSKALVSSLSSESEEVTGVYSEGGETSIVMLVRRLVVNEGLVTPPTAAPGPANCRG